MLREGSYRLALVVVRPELQALAQEILDISATLTVDQTRSPEQWVHLYWSRIEVSFGGIIPSAK